MSFILDALKKSEAERLRKSTPGVADIPDARPPTRTPRWLWLLAGLLAVNLAVLAVILTRPAAEPTRGAVTRTLEVPDTAPAPAFSELVAEARAAQPAQETPPRTDTQQETPARGDTEPRREAAARPAAASPAPAERAGPAPVDTGSLATFDELRARGDLMLEDLHLDLHVYGERPADRFVVINLARYREGAALAEGPSVREILPHGVVLEHEGTTFFLPR